MDIIPNYIANKPVTSGDGTTFPLTSPVDGSVTAQVHEAGSVEVDEAVQAARAALRGPWRDLSVTERSDLLMAVANEIRRRFDDFVEAEMADTGQPRHVMEKAFVPRGAANFEQFAEMVRSVPTETFELEHHGGRALNYALRRPKGVIGVICPWNAPFLLMTWKVAPALAAGNAVVVKPSEETPRTAALLAEVMADVGIPPGVYNVVNGFGPGSAGSSSPPIPRSMRSPSPVRPRPVRTS
ncbi:MAG: aldehyde dehydrogenase family protein [Acidimicrobiales bacterium]